MDTVEAREKIANFYNERSQMFLDFEDELGYNFWYLENFRLYFLLTVETSNRDGKTKVKPNALSTLKTEIRVLREEFFRNSDPTAETLFFINRRIVSQSSDIPFELNMRKGLQICLNRELTTPRFNHIDLTSNTSSSDGIFLSYLFSLSWVFDLLRYGNAMKRAIQSINQTIKEDWERTIWETVKRKGKINFLICHLRYCAFNRFFSRNDVRRIILTDENSPQQKVIQYAARRNNVTTYAVQHGNIARQSPAYMFGEYEKRPIFPDKTFLWGVEFQELLLEHGGYQEHELEVSGRIEAHIAPPSSREEETVLFASQPIRDEALRERYIRDVFQAFVQNTEGYTLVIRPHPMELDETIFHAMAKEAGVLRYEVDRDTPLFEQMAECKALIVAFSTVGAEFLQFNKPMLVLDYNNEDLMGWIRAGLGVQVLSSGQLAEAINSLKSMQEVENRTKQIQRLFYLNDDQGLRRIYDSIGIEK